jgi:hypothetical protein
MDLQLSDRLIRDAAESDIQACVEGDDFFGVLRARPHAYISCFKLDETEYNLEYQDGSVDKHYRATNNPITLDGVLSAFRKYMRGDPSWRTDFRWEKMEFGFSVTQGTQKRNWRALWRSISQSAQTSGEGFIIFVISGGLGLFSYEDWLPEGLVSTLLARNQYSLLVFAAIGLFVFIAPFVGYQIGHQVGRLLAGTSARTQRQFAVAAVIISRTLFGAVIFILLAAPVLFMAFIVAGELRMNDPPFGLILALMVFALMSSYAVRRVRNAAEPKRASFKHVLSRSGYICLTTSFFLLFCTACVFIVRAIEEDRPLWVLGPFAVLSIIILLLFAYHAWIIKSAITNAWWLTSEIIKRDRENG